MKRDQSGKEGAARRIRVLFCEFVFPARCVLMTAAAENGVWREIEKTCGNS